MTKIRTRIAPAPSGRLHLGTAHTALFNYLFTRHNHGQFILRIDDSDAKRSKKEFEKDILEGLKWLGIEWDEGPDIGGPYGPYLQSQRFDHYQPYLEKLLQSGDAYKCFCTREELAKERQEMFSKKLPPKYSGKCRHLTEEQKKAFIKEGRKPVIRFKVEPQIIAFNDPTHGIIKVNSETIGDFVLARSDSTPLLVFTTTIDDIEMKITHTIRGEDFMNLVPKQILIFKALRIQPPIFGHLQFIYGPDGGKLSKRHGAKSVLEFKEEGYLPGALLTFLAYLSWSYKDNSQLLTKSELIKLFDISHIQTGKPTFDLQKLNYFNAKLIRQTSLKSLLQLIKPFLKYKLPEEKLIKIIPLIQERLIKLADINDLIEYFVILPKVDPKALLAESKLSPAETIKYLQAVIQVLEVTKDLETDLHQLQQQLNLSPRQAFMTLRLAVAGRPATPPLFDVLSILGKNEVVKRLTYVQKTLG